jgi:hypothetical protein
MRLISNSWGLDGFKLARLNHERLILHQLDHYFDYQLAIPSRAESAE